MFLDARLGLWVSLEHAFTRVYLQPTKLSDAQVLPTSWLGGSTRGLQLSGHDMQTCRDMSQIVVKIPYLATSKNLSKYLRSGPTGG